MTRPSRERFLDLATRREMPSVSITMPTHVAGPEIEQDPIRLKNAIGRAEHMLAATGYRPSRNGDLLDPVRSLLGDARFWSHRDHGLALYAAAGGLEVFDLADEPVERVMVTDRFHVAPLVASLPGIAYRVVAISMNGVRVFEAAPGFISRAEYQGPESFEDANWFMNREAQVQRHPSANAPGAVHGHDPMEKHKADVERFVSAVTRAVRPLDGTPVVILAVDELGHEFTRLAGYPTLRVAGSPESLEAPVVLERVTPAIVAENRRRQEELIGRLMEALGTGRAVAGFEPVLGAAVAGRVDTLAFSMDASPAWSNGGEGSPGAHDLLDEAIGEVASRAGKITAAPRLPEGHTLIASLRF